MDKLASKAPVNDGLIREVYWELPSAERGVANISFAPETFAKLRRENSLTVSFINPANSNLVLIFSARTIAMGVTIIALYDDRRTKENYDFWEKDFYDLNTNIRNTFMTRVDRGNFTEQTLNGVAFLPDGTKSNPRQIRQG